MTFSDEPYDDEPYDDGPYDDDTDDSTYDEDDQFDEESDTLACPSCGAAIYEDTPCCPICGEYVTFSTSPFSGKPVWWILLGLLGCIALVAALVFALF